MIRPIYAAVAAAMLMAAAPVFAAETNMDTKGDMKSTTMDCNAQMTKAKPMMDSMTDKAKKDQAMQEMNMANDDMAKNDQAGCMTHMNNAMNMMK